MAVTGASTQHGGPLLGGAATGNLGNVLKEEWADEVTSQFSNEATLMRILEEGVEVEDWDGEYFVVPLHTGRNRAGGPGQETDDYPTAGSQGYDQLQVGVAFYRTSGQISSKAIQSAEKGKGSVVKGLQSDINNGLRDLIMEMGIDFYGTPHGLLGYVASVNDGANQITMESNLGGALPAGTRLAKTHGTRYLSGGRQQSLMAVLINEGTGAVTTTYGRIEVTSVDSRVLWTHTAGGANEVTADAIVVALAAGDAVSILRAPSANPLDNLPTAANGANIALTGLDFICDDGTTIPASLDTNYFQVDRTLNPQLNGYVRNLAGGAIDESTLQDFFDAIGDTSGETPDCMIMHRSVRSRIAELFTADRRFVPQEFAGGWKGQYLTYNPGDGDIHVYVDRLCPYRTLFALNKSYLKRATLAPAHLVEYDGSILRPPSNTPMWQWNVESYTNLFSTKPNTCGKMIDIASDATYGDAAFRPEL